MVYKTQKEYEKAIEEFQEAIKINPSNSLFYFNTGITYFEMEMYKDSIIEFKKGIEKTQMMINYTTN